MNHQEAPHIYLARNTSVFWHNADPSDVHRFNLDAVRMPAMIICAKSSPGQMWIVRKDNDSVMVRITWGSGANRAVLLQGYAERHVNNYFNWVWDCNTLVPICASNPGGRLLKEWACRPKCITFA